jgi:hypothetical protein
MLVYAANPKGVLHVAGYRIYGQATGRNPVDVPFEVYKEIRGAVKDATYREDILQKLFGVPFPEIGFSYSELRHLPEDTLDKLGVRMCKVKYCAAWPKQRKIQVIQWALRNVKAD